MSSESADHPSLFDRLDLDTPFLATFERGLVALIGEEQTAEVFRTFGVQIVPVVLDANVIMEDVVYYLRTKRPTGILLSAAVGFVRFFCSTDVRDEVLEHLSRVAKKYATPEEALKVWDQRYAPLIWVLDPSNITVLSPRALQVNINDFEDLPTAKVIDVTRAQIVLSNDKHLSPYNPPRKEWTQLTAAYRDASFADATFVSLRFGGTFAVSITMSSIKALISRILKAESRVILWIGLGLLVVSGGAVIIPPSRRWLKEQFVTSRAWIRDHLADLADIYYALEERDHQAKEARQFLDEKALTHEPPCLAVEYIMEVFVHTYASLTTREISRRMQELGYEPRGEHPERYVARLLRENPNLFERQSSREWRLASSPSASETDDEASRCSS